MQGESSRAGGSEVPGSVVQVSVGAWCRVGQGSNCSGNRAVEIRRSGRGVESNSTGQCDELVTAGHIQTRSSLISNALALGGAMYNTVAD
jgi:hypothetical protein